MAEKVLVTQQGLEDLKNELENLIHVVKPEVIEDLKAARAQGDLSENADYDAAKDKQAQVEAKISNIEEMLKNIELIQSRADNETVSLGGAVDLLFLDNNETLTYSIVGSIESDPINGKLSHVTPLAEAILERKVGDIVEVNVEKAYKVKILAVR